ncbi:pantoate--beta-alanine ligase [Candidatus Saganbacteria bacterium]|uniref:Pantothenate synthetase n=1 Tax=Candidatus Saganbacteria bacterium TaxID=2575572 RepID=A0A9D6UM66_UNCSA|nr:pantoate--beta-alanine ligase [Candidatus Saganbacteria bacterium]
MREIKDPREMYLCSRKAGSHGKKIGFVPTMGALHEGHLSLVNEARRRSDMVVVSIFVNPIQFGPREDFSRYPRNLKWDKKLLKSVYGGEIDVLFLPQASAVFPDDFSTFVAVEGLGEKLCGRSRPTHFRGVATVVLKLFNMVRPDLAFFGEKDYQQQLIIRQMVGDLNLPVQIISVPTVREFDGLAMSSRNAYLNPAERKSAAILYRALCLAKEEIESGEKDHKKILLRVRSFIGTEPRVRLDYVNLVNPETLEDIKELKGKALIAVAAYLGKTRLIDNLTVDVP